MAQNAANIKAIDTQSIHRITSGQVVIDLQTAVKELVENSLDAGATNIEVRFKEYGVESIEVVDNGCGISPGNYDAVALKHHTSKLSSFEDLSSVLTFGFRGEALSSLCTLCESVTVTTATASEAPMGTVLEFDQAGKLVNKTGKVARQRGTTVTVNGLFAPLPVRRKELERNVKREFGKALNLLNAYALVPCVKENKGVRLTCSNTIKGRKTVHLRTDGPSSSRASVSALWGPKSLENIVDLDLRFSVETEKSVLRRQNLADVSAGSSIDVRVCGLVSKFVVGGGRSGTDRQFFYVNGRPCTPSKVQKAFNEVYRTFNANQSPFVVADFIIPTNSLDINVSPDKRNIFIHSENNLIQALKTALEDAFVTSRSTYSLNSQAVSQAPATGAKEAPLFDGDDDEEVMDLSSPSKSQEDGFGAPILLEAPGSESVPAAMAGADGDLADEHEVDPSEVQQSTLEDESIPLSETATQDQVSSPLPKPRSSFADDHSARPPLNSVKTTPSMSAAASTRSVQMVLSTQNASWNLKRLSDSEPDHPRKRLKRDEGSASTPQRKTTSGRQQDLVTRLAGFARSGSQIALNVDRESADLDEAMEDEDVSESEEKPEESNSMEHSHMDHHSEEVESTHDESAVVRSQSIPEVPKVDASGSDDDHMSIREDTPVADLAQGRPESCPSSHPPSAVASLDVDVDGSQTSAPRSAQEVIRTTDGNDICMQFDVQGVTSLWQRLEKHVLATRSTPSVQERVSDDQAVLTRDAGLKTAEGDDKASEVLSRVLDKADFLTMQVVGQFNKAFIITRLRREKPVTDSRPSVFDDLFIVDQHAADEKYNFERLQATTRIEAQKLYSPLPLELTAADELVAVENLDVLRENGFEVSVDEDEIGDGGRRLNLVAQPVSKNTVFDTKDLEELIHLMHDQPRGQMVRCSKARSMFAMRACRTSVMVGMALKAQQMLSVVRNMGTMNQPWHCPHGRPTMRHLSDIVDAGWNRDGPGTSAIQRRFVDLNALA